MSFLESIKTALSSIAANKMRSLLTMLGIIIGISAVITITTLGSSLTATIQNAFSVLGANYFDVYVEEEWLYDEETDSWYPNSEANLEDNLITTEMLDRLYTQYPDCYYNASMENVSSASTTNALKETINLRIGGIMDGYLSYNDFDLVAGRNITLRDNIEEKYSALVSDIFVRQYFKHNEEPIGKTIAVIDDNGISRDFTIVGIYQYSEIYQRLVMGDSREDDMTTDILIPYITAYSMMNREFNGFEYLTLTCNSTKQAEDLTNELRSFFEAEYADTPGISCNIYSSLEELDIISTVINVVTIVISIIAAISLLVGGVGVMNIMLVSVTERTREIGIRKALGAKSSNIRLQFVIEAITICLIGGIIGIIIGIWNGEIFGFIAKFLIQQNEEFGVLFRTIKITPSIGAILISITFSTLIGIFFGLYPASKAAKMNPIDALRYD